MDNEQGWRRLAAAVRDRRRDLGWTQPDVSSHGGPSIDRVQAIEGVRADRYSSRTLSKLERALGWTQGSCRKILAGGDPTLAERKPPKAADRTTAKELADELAELRRTSAEMQRTSAELERRFNEYLKSQEPPENGQDHGIV